MIERITDHGRCELDRKTPFNTWSNQATHDFFGDVAKDWGCSRSDVIEGVRRASLTNPDFLEQLKRHTLLAQNDNRKRPQEMAATIEPELTPEAAFANVDGPIKAASPDPQPEKGTTMKKILKPQKAIEPKGENLWLPITSALKERVSEQNFEVWLSSLRFLCSDEERLVLEVPNTFFQEYLAEHYTEVIQEEVLRKFNKHLEIEFTVRGEETETVVEEVPGEVPINPLLQLMIDKKVSTLDELEALEDSLLPALYQRRLDQALDRATPYIGPDRISSQRRRGETSLALLAEEVAILKMQRLAEEKARIEFRKKRRATFAMMQVGINLREAGNPHHQRQYAKPSHWDTEGGVNRKDLS